MSELPSHISSPEIWLPPTVAREQVRCLLAANENTEQIPFAEFCERVERIWQQLRYLDYAEVVEKKPNEYSVSLSFRFQPPRSPAKQAILDSIIEQLNADTALAAELNSAPESSFERQRYELLITNSRPFLEIFDPQGGGTPAAQRLAA